MKAARSDAADPYDLAGHVDDLESLQEVLTVVGQGGPVGTELLADALLDLVDGQADARGQVTGGNDDRRLTDDLVLSVDNFCELRERLQAVVGVRFLGRLLRRLPGRLPALLVVMFKNGPPC